MHKEERGGGGGNRIIYHVCRDSSSSSTMMHIEFARSLTPLLTGGVFGGSSRGLAGMGSRLLLLGR